MCYKIRTRRHPPHHPMIDLDNRSNILLLTVCAKDRKPILCRSGLMALLCEAWKPRDDWVTGRFVILPDHIHVFCSPMMCGRLSLERWVAAWKSFVSRNWEFPRERPLWQRSFWDRQIRSGEGYDEKWAYVQRNPVRHGLVRNPEEWPFQGEVHKLVWHDR
jgi:putative transposase